jgi:uncharacterized protein (DUF1786 family)
MSRRHALTSTVQVLDNAFAYVSLGIIDVPVDIANLLLQIGFADVVEQTVSDETVHGLSAVEHVLEFLEGLGDERAPLPETG